MASGCDSLRAVGGTFGGTSNAFDFLPLDRAGNRRFIPAISQGSHLGE